MCADGYPGSPRTSGNSCECRSRRHPCFVRASIERLCAHNASVPRQHQPASPPAPPLLASPGHCSAHPQSPSVALRRRRTQSCQPASIPRAFAGRAAGGRVASLPMGRPAMRVVVANLDATPAATFPPHKGTPGTTPRAPGDAEPAGCSAAWVGGTPPPAQAGQPPETKAPGAKRHIFGLGPLRGVQARTFSAASPASRPVPPPAPAWTG